MCNHKKLCVFKLADEIILFIYQVSCSFPKEEIYGLTTQIRRVAISVVSN